MLTKIKKNKKGFTLAELLIVIAIIAILIAIAIPTYTAQLGRARTQVDNANLRAAESIAVADYMLNARTGSVTTTYTIDANGNLVAGAAAITGLYSVTVQDGAISASVITTSAFS